MTFQSLPILPLEKDQMNEGWFIVKAALATNDGESFSLKVYKACRYFKTL